MIRSAAMDSDRKTSIFAIRVAAISIAIALVVLGLKYVAWVLTGSVALLSDALESIINVAAALFAFIALQVASRPADENHPFGHSKAEYFSAVIEGVLIVLAAILIIREAYPKLANPVALELPVLGLLMNGLASVINGAWAVFLIHRGRVWRSIALSADGKHLMTDVLTSIGVLLGVGLAAVTHWAILDPAMAIFVAINILWSGWGLIRGSVDGLMDAAASPEMVARVRRLVSEHATGALEAHDFRTRHAGRTIFIEFHLVVPDAMSVLESHKICDRIEAALQDEVEGAIVTIHVEPAESAQHQGVLVL
jgi:cation diffusion facilitator family transporter